MLPTGKLKQGKDVKCKECELTHDRIIRTIKQGKDVLCPECELTHDRVIKTTKHKKYIERTRKCRACGFTYNTLEVQITKRINTTIALKLLDESLRRCSSSIDEQFSV